SRYILTRAIVLESSSTTRTRVGGSRRAVLTGGSFWHPSNTGLWRPPRSGWGPPPILRPSHRAAEISAREPKPSDVPSCLRRHHGFARRQQVGRGVEGDGESVPRPTRGPGVGW